jgi:hypothetical protein
LGDFEKISWLRADFKDLQRFEVNLKKIEVFEGKKSSSIYKKFVFDVEGRNPKSKSDEIEGLGAEF